MTKKQWLTKKRECLRELESESAEAKHANRHIIASVKYDIKKLEKAGSQYLEIQKERGRNNCFLLEI